MTAGRRRRGPPPDPEWRPGQLLDWRDAAHWSTTAKPCRYCDQPTQLRDSKRAPAHKVCAEAALAQQHADQINTYQNGQTT